MVITEGQMNIYEQFKKYTDYSLGLSKDKCSFFEGMTLNNTIFTDND